MPTQSVGHSRIGTVTSCVPRLVVENLGDGFELRLQSADARARCLQLSSEIMVDGLLLARREPVWIDIESCCEFVDHLHRGVSFVCFDPGDVRRGAAREREGALRESGADARLL